jgi:hypothetical protein
MPAGANRLSPAAGLDASGRGKPCQAPAIPNGGAKFTAARVQGRERRRPRPGNMGAFRGKPRRNGRACARQYAGRARDARLGPRASARRAGLLPLALRYRRIMERSKLFTDPLARKLPRVIGSASDASPG